MWSTASITPFNFDPCIYLPLHICRLFVLGHFIHDRLWPFRLHPVQPPRPQYPPLEWPGRCQKPICNAPSLRAKLSEQTLIIPMVIFADFDLLLTVHILWGCWLIKTFFDTSARWLRTSLWNWTMCDVLARVQFSLRENFMFNIWLVESRWRYFSQPE